MSPKVATPTIEQTLALQAERLRHLEALEIKLPVFDIRAFGAVGDNIVDDRLAIQQTIDAADGGGIVFIPPLGFGANDRYRVEGNLDIRDGVCLMGGHGGASRISAHGTAGSMYPILQYQMGDAAPSHFFVKNLMLGFEDYYADANARCIQWTDAGGRPQPSQFIIENVTLRNGYYGYYDDGSSFMASLRNVMINHCKNGIYKGDGLVFGGSITLDTCYVRGRGNAAWDRQAMYFGEASIPVIINCSIDNWKANAHLCHFEWCPTVIIDGLGMETNEDAGPGWRMLRFQNCGQVDAAGLSVNLACTWPTGGAETDFIRFSNSRAHLSACKLDGVTFTGAGGTGNTIALRDHSYVTIAASVIPTPTAGVGAPTVVAIDMRTADVRLSLDCTTIGVIDNAAGGSYFEHHAGDGPL